MKDEVVTDEHPAFGMISSYRTSVSPPGSTLFDSDIRHAHTVVVRVNLASRRRELSHDWISGHGRSIVEIEMSEAQWASFLSSPNTSGVPCTIKEINGERIERLSFAPRLEQSMKETHAAAERAFGEIKEALRVYEETPRAPVQAKREAMARLRATIVNAVPNVDYAGKTLVEHAENVVQKARADVEAMVARRAAQLGIEAPSTLLLEAGDDQ